MKNFYEWKTSIELDYWTYFKPRFWHLIWRGGHFTLLHNVTKNGTKENEEHYLQCIDLMLEADSGEGNVKWTIDNHKESNSLYEITKIYFKRSDDAMAFKLAWA